jgi:intracellular sulfur oxidation DsrE/DsrF family protein
MRGALAAWAAALGIAASALAGTTELADPKPSFDAPRRIVIGVSEGDTGRLNAVLNNIANIQKFYGADLAKLVVVGYGPGVRALLREDNPVRARIESFQAIDVEFIACGATLESLKKTEADLIKGVETVTNGLPEIVERQLKGWTYLHP